MDDKTFRYQLEIPLIERDYGRSAAEVLRTCALVSEVAEEWSAADVKAFQKRVGVNPQVWSRLIALHKDQRLKEHLERLPASYTALYAISRMNDQEIQSALKEGVINPEASSHSILRWTKENRQLGSGSILPYKCLIVFDRELDQSEFLQMRERIDALLEGYSARLISALDLPASPDLGQSDRNKRIAELEERLKEMLRSHFDLTLEQERNRFGVVNLGDFIHLGVPEFKKLLKSVRVQGAFPNAAKYGNEYVLKLALEYLKTDSRAQRFNYKRRLKDLAESQPELQHLIAEVLQTYMAEKKMVTKIKPLRTAENIPDFFSSTSKTL